MTQNKSSSIGHSTAVPVTNGHVHASSSCSKQSIESVNRQNLIGRTLALLYSENITAKILRVAEANLGKDGFATHYPELVPQSGNDKGKYKLRLKEFWTCGFFPGSIYLLLERATKYPGRMQFQDNRLQLAGVRDKIEALGQAWSEPLVSMAGRIDTHDLGFIMMPHMRLRWELLHDRRALEAISTAAASLYSRFNASVGAIRSWDALTWQKGVEIRSMDDNFLVIVDSLCNLELLFYAAAHSSYRFLAEAAVTHAKTLLRSHLRPEPTSTRPGYGGILYSTCHVVNFNPLTGQIKEVRTAQGFAPSSTWSRGQAWAIMGYAQTFVWTGDHVFLDAACGLAEYFLLKLEEAPDCVEVPAGTGAGESAKAGRYVPLWDFDAPIENADQPLRDVSAGVIAANGMLILAQSLLAQGLHTQAQRYLCGAFKIVEDTMRLSMAGEQASVQLDLNGKISTVSEAAHEMQFDAILRNSTVTWNEHSRVRSADHGLVYADYYLIEFGNRLLQLGYV